MSARVLFLHLSDIHFKKSTDRALSRSESVAKAVYPRLPEVEAVVILVSGDLAFSGTKDQYRIAEDFLSHISAALKSQRPEIPVYIVVCPGNHDCDFSLHDETRDAVLAKIRSEPSGFPSPSLINTSVSVQDEFFSFRNKISKPDLVCDNKLSWHQIITVSKHKLGIRSLNVAWMSELKEKQGTLVFPADAIKSFSPVEVTLSITLLHHPYNWFGQASYRSLQNSVRSASQIVFTGHEHVQNVGEVFDYKTAPSVFVEGGAFAEHGGSEDSAFNIIVVDLDEMTYLSEPHQWIENAYVNSEEVEIWGSLRRVESYSSSKCSVTDEWAKALRDPGANFTHSAKRELDLDDFFVWPELVVLDDTSPVKRNIHGSYFMDVKNLNKGVLIKGDEKAGKTTLLYQLYKSYHERGFLPLYFKGSWFQKQHQDSPIRALKFALDKQYSKSCHVAYQQADKQERILLLDNFDASSLAPSVLSDCIKVFSQYFAHVIITATETDAAMDTLSTDQVDALNEFSPYQIREFGYKKRYELVCKWAELGGQTDVESPQWMQVIDKWEKDLTAAVGRQFVPAVPIFLVTLLQSMEVGRSADLQNSAFGHYYHFLITSSLNNVGIDREQWSEVFNYCSKLAWYMHSSGRMMLTTVQLRKFTDQYREEFSSEVLYERRVKDLTKAGVLVESESEYSFRYPYLYYYFIGQHIGENIHEDEIQTVVKLLCNDLEDRENANTLLFACHHTRSPVIFTQIANALDSCFIGARLFDLDKDAQLLNSLVQSAPSLVYQEQSVKESRGVERQRQDEGVDSDELIARTNNSLTRLFRSMEILGQFLKNHYGTTKNAVKEELISKVLDGALRGLFTLAESLLSNVDVFFSHVEQEAAKQGAAKEAQVESAKKFIFEIVSLLTFGFVHKASSCVGSVHLRDNLIKVEAANPTLANQMIRMSFEFDLPDGLSIGDVRRINEIVEKNVFARALLRRLALKHLHLFKVSYKDKQRLCEILDIGINNQRAVQHQQNRQITMSNRKQLH